MEVRKMAGDPDRDKVGTSYVERQNLTMRMGIRRFTRLTNAFSKKVENHAAAVSLHFMFYNFARPHQTLTKQYGAPLPRRWLLVSPPTRGRSLRSLSCSTEVVVGFTAMDANEALRLLDQAQTATNWIVNMPDDQWQALSPEMQERYCQRLDHWRLVTIIARREHPDRPWPASSS